MRQLYLPALLIPLLAPCLPAGELRLEGDPRSSSQASSFGRNLYHRSLPKDSTFWKVDSDGNEWRKDTYGTIWKKETGRNSFEKGSWEIDGYDRRQATRLGQDSIVQFQLNLDGSVKPESVRRTTWMAQVDPVPSTLPSHLRQAELRGPSSAPAHLQQERPKLIPPFPTPAPK